MPSFTCGTCSDVLTKAKMKKHTERCRPWTAVSCLDCTAQFAIGTDEGWNAFLGHTSCVTEAERYGHHKGHGGAAEEKRKREDEKGGNDEEKKSKKKKKKHKKKHKKHKKEHKDDE